MKNKLQFFAALSMIAGASIFSQSLFAVDVPLKKDLGGATYAQRSMLKTTTTTVLPVSVDLTDYVLDFNLAPNLGTATITITDEYGFVIENITVNTAVQPSVQISTDGWDSGAYTISVSYGTTKLKGLFEL